MLDDNRIFKKDHVITQNLDGNLFALENDICYRFNEIASKIWNLIDGKNNVKLIKEKIKEKYTCSENKIIDKSINSFIKLLIKEKLIR